jgi:hypothetical protein
MTLMNKTEAAEHSGQRATLETEEHVLHVSV